MPEITNATLYKYTAKRAELCEANGQNWSGFDSAVVAMQTTLEEAGCLEMLKPEHKETRLAIAKLLTPLMTAGKNFQGSYVAKTYRKDAEGKATKDFLMAAPKTIERGNEDEV